MLKVALNLDCIVFNVNYRLAPEHKSPVGQEDFVDAFLHVRNNADEFGVDSSKICLAGASGGGWILSGALVILAKTDMSQYVKAAMLETAMLGFEMIEFH